MRFTGEDDDARTLRVVQDAREPRRIVEHERGALVRGKAAREPDREDVGVARVEVFRQTLDQRLAVAVTPVLEDRAPARVREHLALERLPQAPVTVLRDVVDLAPIRFVEQLAAPGAAETRVEQVAPGNRQKRRHVHAVGDVADRVLLRRHLRPDVRRGARGDRAVDARYAVAKTRAAQCQRGLVEAALVRRRRAERQELLHADAELLHERSEIALHQLMIEDVVAGGHRSMRGKHRVGRGRFQRAVEVETLADELAAAFEDLKRGVAFVDVPHRRIQSDRAQRAHAADAEHDLLLDARVDVAAVELVGDAAVGVGVRPGDRCRADTA